MFYRSNLLPVLVSQFLYFSFGVLGFTPSAVAASRDAFLRGELTNCELTLGFMGDIFEIRPKTSERGTNYKGRPLKSYPTEIQAKVLSTAKILAEGQIGLVQTSIDSVGEERRWDLYAWKDQGEIFLFVKLVYLIDADYVMPDFELLLRQFQLAETGGLGPLKIPQPIMATKNEIWMEYVPGKSVNDRLMSITSTEGAILHLDYSEVVTLVNDALSGKKQFRREFVDRADQNGQLDLNQTKVGGYKFSGSDLIDWLHLLWISDNQGAPAIFGDFADEDVRERFMYLNGDGVMIEEHTGHFYYRGLGYLVDWEHDQGAISIARRRP